MNKDVLQNRLQMIEAEIVRLQSFHANMNNQLQMLEGGKQELLYWLGQFAQADAAQPPLAPVEVPVAPEVNLAPEVAPCTDQNPTQ
jgi:hypothetical protein